MSRSLPQTIHLQNEDDTVSFARDLTGILRPGDTVLLEGPLGSGKTFLARHIIQHRLAKVGRYEEVPSPSFTLVQTYDDGESEILHADLYRLNSVDEHSELGLAEAFDSAICLIEWPDRLGDFAPPDSLKLSLAQAARPDGRMLTMDCKTGAWDDRLRGVGTGGESTVERFLSKGNWKNAARRPLAGDASNRRYERLAKRDGETAVLMIAPPPSDEGIETFVSIAKHLKNLGLSAPAILQSDVAAGYLLLEDLGDQLYARYAADYPDKEDVIYEAAVDALIELHRHAPPSEIGVYDTSMLAERAALSVKWYARQSEGCAFSIELEELFAAIPARSSVLALRDFHSENLLWLPERTGVQRVGLLDFQDALACHPAYDLVSLTKDARRDLREGLEASLISRFLDRTGHDHDEFLSAFSLYGAQRNLRILGVFARLASRDAKPGYLKLIPRVWRHLQKDLAHPKLALLRELVMSTLPEPSGEHLAELERSCPPNL